MNNLLVTEDGAKPIILTTLLKDNHLTLKDVWEDNGYECWMLNPKMPTRRMTIQSILDIYFGPNN